MFFFKKYPIQWSISLLVALGLLLSSCDNKPVETDKTASPLVSDERLEKIAYDAFIYAYPMMEQVKTINGMFNFMAMKPNKVSMNSKLPWENVGMPIVAPNLTSMTGGVFIDISSGPVTLEIPKVKDRYIVYQCIDVFTHNFYYMGTRGNNGEAGRFIFHNASQTVTDSDAIPVLMEGDHAIIVNRIDIKEPDEAERVRGIQQAIKVVDAPESTREYPTYDEKKAFSPEFVDYLNELLTEIPASEQEMFTDFAAIGIKSDVVLTDNQKQAVQRGIDSAYKAILAEMANIQIGNGYVGATELFGTREFLDGNYLGRAIGANFGLWGNSKEEANYFMTTVEGEGKIVFSKDELPPLSDIGFWSVTAHDENVHVNKNDHDSYVITMDKMIFEEDGSVIITFSKEPQQGNWLYTPGEKMIILIRAYQADGDKIGAYVPPAFEPVVSH